MSRLPPIPAGRTVQHKSLHFCRLCKLDLVGARGFGLVATRVARDGSPRNRPTWNEVTKAAFRRRLAARPTSSIVRRAAEREVRARVAIVVFVSILIPIAAGIFLHTRAPAFAERIARPLTSLSGLGVVACIIVVWIAAAPAMWLLIGNGTVIALAAFVLVGLAIGHILGGPEPQNRTALAIATASRHPGIALILAKANFPAETLVGPARCH
jgi:hypothetical protein